MPPLQQQESRIDLAELKAQIVKKLGTERAQHYFNYLNRLLSQKLSKTEFDKLCYSILGRENLSLHNLFIRSILKNACQARVPPPPIHEREFSKPVKEALRNSNPGAPLIWSNGDAFPISPCKGRSGIRDRKLRDRPSPLISSGKTDLISHLSNSTDEATAKIIMENGELGQYDLQRPMQHHQGLAEQPENDQVVSISHPTKKPRIKRSPPHDQVTVHSKGTVELVMVEDGEEEVEQTNKDSTSRRPLRAPLGIPFCLASVGGARRKNNSSFTSSSDEGELSDTESLRKRMEQIAETEGLNGVSTDCANLLNIGLDLYLKRLIRSCVELVGARSLHEPITHSVYKQHPHGKVINGTLPGSHVRVQSSEGSIMEGLQESRRLVPISLLDFKVAMELNPQQLGEDWPLILEKICLYSCEK